MLDLTKLFAAIILKTIVVIVLLPLAALLYLTMVVGYAVASFVDWLRRYA